MAESVGKHGSPGAKSKPKFRLGIQGIIDRAKYRDEKRYLKASHSLSTSPSPRRKSSTNSPKVESQTRLKKLLINECPILTIEITQKKLQRYYDLCGGQYGPLIEKFASV